MSNRKTEKGFFVRAKETMKKVKQLSSFSSELKFFVQQENRSNCPSKTKPKYAKSLSHTKIKIFIFCLSADSKSFSRRNCKMFFLPNKIALKNLSSPNCLAKKEVANYRQPLNRYCLLNAHL